MHHLSRHRPTDLTGREGCLPARPGCALAAEGLGGPPNGRSLGQAKQVWKPFIDAERAAGVAGDDDRYLLIQDNLDAQLQKPYLKILREEKEWVLLDKA